MPESEGYLYENRVVAFLDVLGFKEQLHLFEKEAISAQIVLPGVEADPSFQSQKANAFIDTFLEAVSRIDSRKFRYYLFSDNICLTLNYDKNKESLVDLLMVVSDLYYSFAKKGYFLRGGIDFGRFISQDRIALGVPLVNAYILETDVANYPRIVLSPNFTKILEEYTGAPSGTDKFPFFIQYLINSKCENKYLNVFLKVFQLTDERVSFFKDFRAAIEASLLASQQKEKIHAKFSWLASEFNNFIDSFVNEMAYLDSNIEPTDDFINEIRNLKITIK